MSSCWLTTKQVANLSGKTSRWVRELAKSSYSKQAFLHGHQLIVRKVSGCGGSGGIQYEVRADSLPPEFQALLKGSQISFEDRSSHGTKAQIERERWYSILEPALRHEKGSLERAAAIRDIASREHLTPRTIRSHLKRYDEEGGMKGLGRRKRADTGQARTLISRTWDKAVTFDDAERVAISERLFQHIKKLWRSGVSLKDVIRLSSEHLEEMTRKSGYAGTNLAEICLLPRPFVEQPKFKRYRKVHIQETDAKAFKDGTYYIPRNLDGLEPMSIVVGDVHHMDVLVVRPDGSVATPKLIAWCDVATGRFRCDIILLEKDEGVRNTDVIASFMNMVLDPAWGMPQSLYLDNGSEYKWAEFLDDALKVVPGGVRYLRDGASHVILAQPYNAPAKVIEQVFSNLEKRLFSQLSGYIGGNRMKAKTKNVGKAPTPFKGQIDDLRQGVAGLVAYYETCLQKGQLKGRSPRQVYTEFVNGGWKRTDIDTMQLAVAFSERETRIVHEGGKIDVLGKTWTSDELAAYNGETVIIFKPKFLRYDGIPVLTADGKAYIGLALEERTYSYLDPAGAEESGRRKALEAREVRKLGKEIQRVNVVDLMAKSAERQLPAPIPESHGTITISGMHARIAADLNASPEERRDREREIAEAEEAEVDAIRSRSVRNAKRMKQAS